MSSADCASAGRRLLLLLDASSRENQSFSTRTIGSTYIILGRPLTALLALTKVLSVSKIWHSMPAPLVEHLLLAGPAISVCTGSGRLPDQSQDPHQLNIIPFRSSDLIVKLIIILELCRASHRSYLFDATL